MLCSPPSASFLLPNIFFSVKKIDFMVPLSVYFIITAFVNLIASFTVLTEEMSLLLKDIICHVFDYVYLLL